MGFFSGLDAEAYDRSYRDRDLVLRIARYFKPYGGRLVVIALTIALMSGASVLSPILLSRGVDWLVGFGDREGMIALASGLFALGLTNWGANWARRRLTSRTIGDVMFALRMDAFQASAEHDLSFFDEFSSGRIVSRITSDTQDFSQVVVLITDLFSQILQAVILAVVLAGIEWRLTLWVLAFMPVVLLSALAFRRLARQVTRKGFRAMANVNSAIKEAVTGIVVSKNFRQEHAIYREFEQVNQQSYHINVRRGFVLSIVFPFLNALGGMGTALIVYIGGMSAAQGAVTIGAWYLFVTSLDTFWFPVLNLSAFWSQVQNGLSAAERVFALIDAEAAVTQVGQEGVDALRGKIAFEGLDFHYVPGQPVLSSFNLTIAPGENLALVGHTGAGKSSIANLIARFYEFQGGWLRIDGRDIRSFDLREYRRHLGIVSQVPFLFSGTVADNIRYASTRVPDDEIAAIAMRIGQGEWLQALPEGLDTEVGERGNRLSMGQRQLVSLMRVLVHKPAIFILDEATASIDPFTESQIQEALEMILAETTSILIAHRLSTVRAADRIVVLKEGRILEMGSHKELMFNGGHYAELYNTYFRHQSIDYRPALEPEKASLGFVQVNLPDQPPQVTGGSGGEGRNPPG